jgi:Fe-S oxidoreductase
MERIVEKNRQNPESAANEGFSFNPFNAMYEAGSTEDKATLDKWTKAPAESKDTLFIGCFGRTMAHSLDKAKSLSTLAKFGPRDACCGEVAYRRGQYDVFSETVERTLTHFETLHTDRLVCYCGSCAYHIGSLWTNGHGVKLPFEVISLYEWLWEKVQSGELTVQNPVSKDMAIHDPCYASGLGDGFYDALRGLHKAIGMNVVELENNRYNSLCCGASGGLRDNFDFDVEAKKRVDQIVASGARDVSCGCPGCWANFVRYSREHHPGIRAHYSITEILQAFGDSM